MVYTDFQDKKLSQLGLGCMRLPVIEGNNSEIDKEATAKIIDYAIKNGINYFDTAWGYHGGNSELVVGEILSKYPRDSFCISSKFPGYDPNVWDNPGEVFEKQLEKCRVTYFDFYLLHNLCGRNAEAYTNPEYKIFSYLAEQKKQGRIRHLGVSVHASLEILKNFLDAHPEEIDFCQIELNYFDYKFQDAKAKVELLNERNIPIWIMEPVRGGQLARLAPEYEAKLKAARPDESIPAWAFRYLQTFPTVKMILSGMSNDQQLRDNIETFKENKPLNEEELSLILGIADEMIAKNTVPCTGCKYCETYCPQELPISRLMNMFNEGNLSGAGTFKPTFGFMQLPDEKKPTNCLQCGACEQVCPQQIKISEHIKVMADSIK